MRFIDMFMTALGSLLFLSVLLSYLLINFPRMTQSGIAEPRPVPVGKLKIVTDKICPAHVKVAYHCALAYRGNSGPVSWRLSHASLPLGVGFDTEEGVFSGTPNAGGTTRFVIEASDANGAADPRDYELVVTAPIISVQKVNMWIAAFLLVVLLLASLAALGGAISLRAIANAAQGAWIGGETKYTISRGPHRDETIKLPEGIQEYLNEANMAMKMARFTFFGALGVAAYVAWLVWG